MSWIGAAANVIGGLFGLGGNIYQADQANKWNQKQLDAQIAENQKNRDFNHSEAEIARNFQARFAREMFDKTNKYNSMSNQIAQLREAGLNPALMYSGSSFAPGSMPSVSAGGASGSGSISPTQYATTDTAGPALAIARQQAEIANIEASTKKIESDTVGQNFQNDILKSDAAFRDAWNEGLLDLNGVQITLAESQSKVNDEQVPKLRKEAALLDKDIQAYDKQLQLLEVQIESGNLDNIGKRIDNYFKTPQYEALIDKIHADTGKTKAEISSILSRLPYEIDELKSRSGLQNSQIAVNGTVGAMNTVMTRLYGLQGNLVITNNKLASIDLQNASDVRSTRAGMGVVGSVLYCTKDLISGIISAPVK